MGLTVFKTAGGSLGAVPGGFDSHTPLPVLIRVVNADQRERLQQRLEELKQEGEHVFSGTIARYIIWSKPHPGVLEILLIWRSTTMPEEADRAEALEQFQRALADVLDWESARYDEGQILLHT